MNRIRTFAVPTLLLLAHATLAYSPASPSPADSVGLQRKAGKRFVLHRVDQGQTLYAVSRRYGVSIETIKAANPDLAENSLRFEQLLRVPIGDASAPRGEQRETEKVGKKSEKETLKSAKETEQTTDNKPVGAAKTEPKPQPKLDKPTEKTPRASAAGIHVVENGQTLYGLAARYRVSMADLRRWNELGLEGIQEGRSLIVSEKAYEAKQVGDTPALTASAGVVKVKPAPVKDVEPEPIKKEPVKSEPVKNEPVRNEPIKSEPIKGELIKNEPVKSEPVRNEPTKDVSVRTQPVKLEAKPIITPAPLPTPGTKPSPKPAEVKPAEVKPAEIKPEEKRPEPKATTPKPDNEPVATTRRATANIKSDIGFAELIEGNNSSAKYLALHRSAPIGTLVQVRNDITNQSLYVKVIGKLPDTGINNDILIRLSGRAFEKLSPNGQRFRAEVSYSN